MSSGLPNRTDTKRSVQPQKVAGGFRIKEVAAFYYLCSKNKDADQLLGCVQLICAFVFSYAKACFLFLFYFNLNKMASQ